VSSSGRSSPSRGSSIVGAPKADRPQDTVEAHGSKGPNVGDTGGDGVPISSAVVAAGVAALEVVAGDGSSASEVLSEGDTNVTAGEMAAGDPAATTGTPHQASDNDDGGARCPVHNSTCHNDEEGQEIKKLMKQYNEQRVDSAPSYQREGKQKVDPKEDKDDRLGFQKAKRDLKAVYGHSDSESNDNERCKMLYIMFGGSWDITSCHIVKNLCREVAAAAPTLKAAPHRKWMETSISFNAFDCPRAWQGSGSSHCSSPQPSSTSSCTTSLSMVVQRCTPSA
jgi:hypothetical protein